MAETITSPSNAAIKLARALIARRRIREREHAFVVDGLSVLLSLVESGSRLRILFVDSDRRHEVAPDLLDRLTATAERVLLLDKRLFRTVSDTDEPQPLAGIFAMADVDFSGSARFILALDSVRDPGNLGTIIRTANAAGADGIALLPGTTDPYSPKSVRASAGTIARLPVRSCETLDEISTAAFVQPPRVVLADSAGTIEHDQVDWTRPSLVIVGNEARGASRKTQRDADIVAKIPIHATVDSLNAAIASAVVMFEAQRQWRQAVDENWRVHANLY